MDSGFRNRCSIFQGGKKAEFLSRLDFDLGNQELFLLNNLDLLFTIYKAKDHFMLQNLRTPKTSADGEEKIFVPTKFRVLVHNIKLYAKILEVQPSLNLAIYAQLEKQPAKYSLRKTEIKSTFLTAGRTEIDHCAFNSIVPRRLTIALVKNDAFNGELRKSPFKFESFGLRDLSVSAEGMVYPMVPYNI
uniref:Uncharacterized protein n=1 Tax=Ditylenchus dipsaci TaxID=166011 RepID=A0A915EIF2_9BILA